MIGRPRRVPRYRVGRAFLAAALARSEHCMRRVASNWAGIPGRYRYELIQCANEAADALAAAGFRQPRKDPP